MLRRHVSPALFGLSAALLLAVALVPVHASVMVVQQNSAGCLGCSSSLSVSFASSVSAGDEIVVGVVVGEASFALSSLTDSLGSSFIQAVTSVNTPPPIVYIYYAPLTRGGEEVVTATFTAAAPAQSIYIYELSGVKSTGIATGAGSGSGSSISTLSSISFPAGAFLLAVIGTNSLGGNVTAGTGFTVSSNNSGPGCAYAQYSLTNESSQTRFQAAANSAVNWAEVAIMLPPA